MSSSILPKTTDLPALSAEERASVLSQLFEPCQALSDLVLDQLVQNMFSSYDEVIEHVRGLLLGLQSSIALAPIAEHIDLQRTSADTCQLLQILGAHPRLGAKKIESEHSKKEQASLAGSQDEAEQLRQLNDEYENTFPGLRYVVFVNGRSRPVIMKNMRWRITRGDIEAEKSEAINAMCDIAKDRARKLA